VTAASHAHRFPDDLVEAALALNDNRLDIAERLLKARLKRQSDDPRALRMLAEVAARIGRLHDSETLLRHALEVAPGFQAARANLAMVLGRAGRPAEALPLLDELFAAEGDALGHLNLKAATLGRLGDFEEAIAIYRRVLDRAPHQPRLWLSYGHMLKTIGRLEEGIAAYRQAIALKPTLGEAWFSLSNLKTVKFSDDDVARMTELLKAELTDEDRLHLEFALGKAWHDRRNPAQAFAHFAAGNAIRRKAIAYDPERIRRRVDRVIATFTAERLHDRAEEGCPAPDPIFIVGMPRAGSTLVEQILSSHSMVEGTSELADMPALAREHGRYPEDYATLEPEQLRAMGEEYLRRTAVQRRTGRPLFIDKLPNNWMFVPLIHLALPNATIIDARRHPLSCCFSNFRQHFARGQGFSYDLADMGHYYADYVRLMAHVDAVLPGKVHRVIYEQMVADPEAEIRRLLDHAGLPFEQGCLEYWKTERAVRTPSSEQVRQPIYRQGTEEWQPYDDYLSPLKDALGPTLHAYPDAPSFR
jgi:tetratricopeptide (TPR) repeat protein